jgi:hypothetical protein
MFGIFKKKSEIEVLQQKYEKLMEEAYKLSTVNRAESDKKVGEADLILKQIEALSDKKD